MSKGPVDLYELLPRMRAAFLLLLVVACKDTPPPPIPAATSPSHADERIIFQDSSGRTLRTADLANATGQVNWTVVGGDGVLEAASSLFETARTMASKGAYAKAIESFGKAHDAAPTWPYPLYELAYTYQLMDQPENALPIYEQVIALAPRGFFTAHATLDCLRREAAKEWAAGMCKRYAMVEFADPTSRHAELLAITAAAPGITPAWKDLALEAEDDVQRTALLDKALANKPDVQTRGLVLANQALALDRLGKRAEATKILAQLVLDPTSALDVVEISKMALAQMTDR